MDAKTISVLTLGAMAVMGFYFWDEQRRKKQSCSGCGCGGCTFVDISQAPPVNVTIQGRPETGNVGFSNPVYTPAPRPFGSLPRGLTTVNRGF